LIEYLRVYDNSFTNNFGSNLIKITGPQNSNASYNFLYMKNNIFVNPNCQYELYNEIPYGSPNLFLDNNYWGSSSSSHIDSVIYDYFDFANQSVVYYSPFLDSPFTIDTTCREFIDMPVGLDDYIDPLKKTLLIYPNPFSTQTNIQSDYYLRNATLVVTNSFGQTVKQMQNLSGETIAISRDNLSAGLYFVRLIEKGKVIITGKLIVTDE
jgi:Secretion system C-terminal sorting domain